MSLRRSVSEYLDLPGEASDDDLSEAVYDGTGSAVWIWIDDQGLKVGAVSQPDLDGATLTQDAFEKMTPDDFNNWMDEAIESSESIAEMAAEAILKREH